jgi:hypothetical protein
MPSARGGRFLLLLATLACAAPAQAPAEETADVADAGSHEARPDAAMTRGDRAAPEQPQTVLDAAVPADAPAVIAVDAAVIADALAPEDPPVDASVVGGDAAEAPWIGGPPRPCRWKFCESFEDVADGAAPNPAVWTRNANDVVVATGRPARGTKSLHVGPLNGGSHYVRESKSFDGTGAAAFYGRMFLWVERFPVESPQLPTTVYHWDFFEASGKPDGSGFVVRLGGHNRASGELFLRLNIEPHSALAETGLFDKNFPMKAKRWYCIEWFLDGPNNEARFWYDGVERTDLHWQKTKPEYVFPTAFRSMNFGWYEHQGTKTPYEVYMDEIVLDSQRIGCAE